MKVPYKPRRSGSEEDAQAETAKASTGRERHPCTRDRMPSKP